MKKFGLLLCTMFAGILTMYGQGAKNIKINEVLTNNTANLQDEFGNRRAWIELANTSFPLMTYAVCTSLQTAEFLTKDFLFRNASR